ncbi:hypothetical protein AVEN_128127-1 [Araneus ventricosus]|uniref:Uncharacterized protein n=1 Tax=Araneus ventricosus TaxID=182803 RepID=A0A4Y2A0N4_ARAVE|nr:hypothetical protein AVEN_128127-1 [Araneus ventricosus]
MAITLLKDIRYFAHALMFHYENEKNFPAEISCVRISVDDEEENRCVILNTVNKRNRYMSPKDLAVNRLVSRNISKMSYRYSREEAESTIVNFIGDALVTVKGLDQKQYFQSLGLMRDVELKSEFIADCLKFHLTTYAIPTIQKVRAEILVF